MRLRVAALRTDGEHEPESSRSSYVSAIGLAQSKTASKEPQWLLVSIVKLNPGATAEYLDLQTKQVMPAALGQEGADALNAKMGKLSDLQKTPARRTSEPAPQGLETGQSALFQCKIAD